MGRLLATDMDDVMLLTDGFDLYRAGLSSGRRPIDSSHRREIRLGL